jgi:eukaryotic translation initiation factor 2C
VVRKAVDFQSGPTQGAQTGHPAPQIALQNPAESCRAGTSVETGMTSPYYFDFYLQSHKGVTGTAEPSHYSVLRDDVGFGSEALQDFIHSLCDTYAKSSTGVSYAAPEYYADKLRDPLRHYFAKYYSGSMHSGIRDRGARKKSCQQTWKNDWKNAYPRDENWRNPWCQNLKSSMFDL